MEREVSMEEISDGKRYRATDMVRIGCRDCEGCSECCRFTDDTIVLDPYDFWQLETNLGMMPEELLEHGLVELAVYNGIILPHLSIGEDGCKFLSREGRCGIHAFRPGFCRLFPLGRVYENGTFDYFLQTGQCNAKATTKVRIDKWLGIPELKKYEAFVLRWHDYTKAVVESVKDVEDERRKSVDLALLKTFYLTPWEKGDFYEQFERRMQ